MTQLNKHRFLLIFALIAAVLFTSAFLFTRADALAPVQAEAATIAPEGWEDWESWNNQATKSALSDFSGSGTSGDPYQISSGYDLASLSIITATGGVSSTDYFALTTNIDLAGYIFVPIGTEAEPFYAYFSGSNYIIKNLYVLQSGTADRYAGLFGYAGGGSYVTKLGILGGIVKNSVGSSLGTGGLAGYFGGTLEDSFSTADAVAIDGNNVGGLVGKAENCAISDCYTNSYVSGIDYVGGVIGNTGANTKIVDVIALGVTTGDTCVGGTLGNRYFEGATSTLNSSINYSYYNSDANPTLANAVGAISDNESRAYNEDTETNKNKSLTESNFQDYNLSDFGFISGKWSKKYASSDGSARYSIAITKISAGGNSDLCKESLIMRIYGYVGGAGSWGTENNPYVITTVEQFARIAEIVNGGSSTYENNYFLLANDLDFDGIGVAPIGVYGQAANRPFRGTFDGANFTISNYVLNRTEETDGKENYMGIFGYVSTEGTVKNLVLSDTCSIKAINYVGSLVGRCDGTVANIRSDANVQGTLGTGGVIGYTANGSFKHILSNVNVSANAGSTSALYGIIGYANGLRAVQNCWYVVNYNEIFKTTNSWGSVLVIDKNGEVTLTKDATGAISFFGVPNAGWLCEFRDSSESVVSTSASNYAANKDSTLQSVIVYARFVKTVSTINASNVTLSLSGSGNYYEGQNITLTSVVDTGYYLANVLVNKTGALSPETSATFAYSDALGLMATFAMTSTLTSVSADVRAIEAPAIEDRVYNGVATSYSITVSGFDVTYAYSACYAPKNAGDYTLTVIIRKDSVQRGKKLLNFTINTLQLTVPDEAVLIEKEFDGKNESVATVVGQSEINIIAGDSVTVEGYIYFYNYTAVTAGESNEEGYVDFAVEGAAAANYSAPVRYNFSTGRINKRTISVSIESRYLSRTYDGTRAAVSYFGLSNTLTAHPAVAKIAFYALDDLDKASVNAVNAGTYGVKVYTNDEATTDFYELVLANEYTFTVNPMPLTMTITDLTGLVYDGNPVSVGATYVDENNLKVTLLPEDTDFIYKRLINGEYVLDEAHTYAGNYGVFAVIGGNYTVNDATTDSDNRINAAYFSVGKALQPTLTVSASEGPYSYGGSAVTLSVSGGAAEESAITYNVTDGFGAIDGDSLTFTGGGTIKVTATKAESENYLEGTSDEYSFEVTKATIAVSISDFSVDYSDEIVFPYVFEGFTAADEAAGITVPAGFAYPTTYINTVVWTAETLYEARATAYSVLMEQDAVSNGYLFTYSGAGFNGTPVKMTVNKKTINVRATDVSVAYGEEEVELAYTIDEGDCPVVGTLTRESGNSAGTYVISAGTMTAEANPNYNLTFHNGEYVIAPLTLTIKMATQQKYYGEDDPTPVYSISGLLEGETEQNAIIGGSITRRAGENAYSANTEYGFYPYTSSGLVISPNYTLKFISTSLYIYPITPTFSDDETAFSIQFGSPLSSVEPTAVVDGDVGGMFVWVDGSIVPDFTESATLKFDATFVPTSRNYKSTTVQIALTVIARELELTFKGETELTYNGLVQKDMTYTLENVIAGDELNENFIFDGDFILPGEYTVRLEITNNNYAFTGDSFVKVVIKKAPLTIYINDIVLPEGVTPEKNFLYEGFVNGETAETALDALPDVTFYSAIGNYEIKPYGASAANYIITYRTSSQTVAKTTLSSDVQGFSLDGNFDYRMELLFSELKQAENKSKFALLESQYQEFKTLMGESDKTKLSRIFNFGTVIGDEEIAISGTTRASMDIPTRLREAKVFKVLLINEDGTMNYAENVVRDGNTLSFDMVDCDYIALATPPDYTWVIILVVIVVLVVAVFVLDNVSEKIGIGRYSEKAKAKRAAKKRAKQYMQ